MISLYLIGQKGYQSLISIVENHTEKNIKHVIIGKDNGLDNDFSSNIEVYCQIKNIPYYFREDYKGFDDSRFKIAIGWKWIIKDTNNLIVFHDSLLPKYRGFCPLANMLINKEEFIGVTALFATEKYDEGPIILQKKIKIDYPIKISEAIERISKLYGILAVNIVEEILSNNIINATPQDNSKATYSLWRDEEDYRINWKNNADDISRFIDSVSKPFSGAKSIVDNDEIRIFESRKLDYDVKIENRELHIGKVIFFENKKPVVICGKGLLKIEKLDKKIKFRTRFK